VGVAVALLACTLGAGGAWEGRLQRRRDVRETKRGAAPWVRLRPRVVCFGDSLTEYGQFGWVSDLGVWFGRKADVMNRGFAGYTSRMAAAMLDVIQHDAPSLLIVFYGTNDAAMDGHVQHVPIAEYKSNLERIVTWARHANPQMDLLLVTPPPVYDRRYREHCISKGAADLVRDNARARTYAEACKDVGRRMSVATLDLWTALGGEWEDDERAPFFTDGLHFTKQGNHAVFREVSGIIASSFKHWNPSTMRRQMPLWNDVDAVEPNNTFWQIPAVA